MEEILLTADPRQPSAPGWLQLDPPARADSQVKESQALKTTKEIAAIPTVYRGVQLRSRMEAQCAFLFDKLGWQWKYEPFSVMLPNGIAYRPDFFVTEPEPLIVECRGYDTEKGRAQIDGFASLIEQDNPLGDSGYVVSEEVGEVHRFLVIGPAVTKLYSAYELKYSLIPASDRKPWHEYAPTLYRCGCGWCLLGTAGWCPNCEQYASEAALISVRDGRVFLNGLPMEGL